MRKSGRNKNRYTDQIETGTGEAFIRESNRIEGILRDPTDAEIAEYHRFMALPIVTVEDLQQFVKVYQPGAYLREREWQNVRVGDHVAPQGGPEIRPRLALILGGMDKLSPYNVHRKYEVLHPFIDGNGRSGRMLWMWQMREAPLGFLHTFYYQALQDCARA